jgi:hypothetical protein
MLLYALLLCVAVAPAMPALARAQALVDSTAVDSTLAGLRDSTAMHADSMATVAAGESTLVNPADNTIAVESESTVVVAVRPTYQTDYSVNRTTSNWGQKFSFTMPVGPLILTHSSSGDLSRDTREARRRPRRLTSHTELTYKLGDALSFGAIYEIPRDHYSDTSVKRQIDKADLSIRGSFHERLWNRLQFDLGASGGQASDKYNQLYFFGSRNVSAPDSTVTSNGAGARGSVDGRLDYTTGPLSVNSSYAYSRSSLDTRTTVARATTDTTNAMTAPRLDVNRDVNNNFASTISLRPNALLSGSLSLANRTAQFQYYSEYIQGQETRTTLDRSAALHTSLSRGTLQANANLSIGTSQLHFQHGSDRSYEVGTLHFDADANWILYGVSVKAKFSSDSSRYEYPRESVIRLSPGENNNTYNHSASLSLSRTLNRRTYATANASLSLLRYVYDTKKKLDRDTANKRADLAVNYNPGRKVTMGLTFGASINQNVNISSASSQSNTDERIYTLQPSFTYRVTRYTTLTQTYSVTSDYTVYTFNETDNRYTGTWAVTSGVVTTLSPRVSLTFNHYAQLRETGSYRRNTDTSPRYFGKAQENHNQDITLMILYQPTRSLSVSASQRLTLSSSYSCPENCMRTGESRLLELNEGASFQQTLHDGTSIRSSFRRVTTGRDKPYWIISAGLSHTF